MCTSYHCTMIMIDVAYSPMPTQNQTMKMNMIKKSYGDLVVCDCHTTMMIQRCLVPTHNEN